MKALIPLVTLAFAACGSSGDESDRDTTQADTSGDVASEIAEPDADVAPDRDEDASDEADASEVSDINDGSTLADVSVPLDRNCTFDPRLGNQWPDDSRCKTCRAVVGNITTKVGANLIWWGRYDSPKDVPALCEGAPVAGCHAAIAEAELIFCENPDNGTKRVVWADVGVITIGDDDPTPAATRGPGSGLFFGEVLRAAEVPLMPSEAFAAGRWLVQPLDGKALTLEVQAARPGQQCSVGRYSLSDGPRFGTVQPCQRAEDTYAP